MEHGISAVVKMGFKEDLAELTFKTEDDKNAYIGFIEERNPEEANRLRKTLILPYAVFKSTMT